MTHASLLQACQYFVNDERGICRVQDAVPGIVRYTCVSNNQREHSDEFTFGAERRRWSGFVLGQKAKLCRLQQFSETRHEFLVYGFIWSILHEPRIQQDVGRDSKMFRNTPACRAIWNCCAFLVILSSEIFFLVADNQHVLLAIH